MVYGVSGRQSTKKESNIMLACGGTLLLLCSSHRQLACMHVGAIHAADTVHFTKNEYVCQYGCPQLQAHLDTSVIPP